MQSWFVVHFAQEGRMLFPVDTKLTGGPQHIRSSRIFFSCGGPEPRPPGSSRRAGGKRPQGRPLCPKGAREPGQVRGTRKMPAGAPLVTPPLGIAPVAAPDLPAKRPHRSRRP
jgi:hypothetical protein